MWKFEPVRKVAEAKQFSPAQTGSVARALALVGQQPVVMKPQEVSLKCGLQVQDSQRARVVAAVVRQTDVVVAEARFPPGVARLPRPGRQAHL